MNKIIFRAWDWRNEKMHLNPFNGKIGGLNDIFSNPGNWIYMQYTGETDKNGTKVFEGDILTANTVIGKDFCKDPSHFTDHYIVTFENGKFTFGGYTFDNGFVKTIEVIGNVYENEWDDRAHTCALEDKARRGNHKHSELSELGCSVE